LAAGLRSDLLGELTTLPDPLAGFLVSLLLRKGREESNEEKEGGKEGEEKTKEREGKGWKKRGGIKEGEREGEEWCS